MARAAVVELDAEVLEHLSEYVAQFMADFGLIIRRYWAEVYLQGLFLDGERKSIQPLAQRVTVPGWSGDTMQALQQFVNQSPWDEEVVWRTYRRLLAASLGDPTGVIVIDDTGFAKKGRHSVGVARQYSGTLGKTDNCQVAVSLHYAAPLGDYPLGLRLFLPESWKTRWHVEQGYQLLKEELGLDHFEGRSWAGFHHHATLCCLAYGFLTLERLRGMPTDLEDIPGEPARPFRA